MVTRGSHTGHSCRQGSMVGWPMGAEEGEHGSPSPAPSPLPSPLLSPLSSFVSSLGLSVQPVTPCGYCLGPPWTLRTNAVIHVSTKPTWPCLLYSFPTATVASYHKFTTKTTHICYLTILKGRIQHRSHWAKIKVCTGLVPSETLGKNPFPCHFQLLEAAYIPGLMATSFQPLLPSLTL